MTTISFITPDGTRHDIDARDGQSVMQVALAADLEGIIGECGGSMMCATCHCYDDESRSGPRRDGEEEMLESAACEVTPDSRLSCQIRVSPALEGLVIRLPETQL
ncbi:MAG: 2Fe-2S iron-sulfur cluster-binding protein [Paracoccus sp. (in: a-proteobacteria)]|uniref:2Fe-2S iron-sulfur cluster-binding protein n=1 Tax=Paracoccus sp. TaxID=267 RepID=UPI0039196F1E